MREDMNYMGDVAWWNNRFKNRSMSIMNHEKCLEDDISLFQEKKTILDLACGDGRNTIYLAKLGYHVHAVDFSIEAINRLKVFANKEKLSVKTSLLDFSNEGFEKELDTYDAIIINHYRLQPEMYQKLLNSLNNNGLLWVNGFLDVPTNNSAVSFSDIIQEEDFNSLSNNFIMLINKKVYTWNDATFVRYLWKKNQ